MMRYFILALAALYCSIATRSAHCVEPKTITITIESQMPSVVVQPTIEGELGALPKAFTAAGPATYEYKFPVSEQEWFDDVDIKLLWKNAYENNDGPPSDFEQHIVLRLRRDFPSSFTIPIFFSNDRSQREMVRLERETGKAEQFERYLRGQQIAAYYRDALGPQHPFTKRAAKIFFYGAFNLAETAPYLVEMSEDAKQFVVDSFGGSSTYSSLALSARSMFWYDLKKVDAYAAKGDCATARMILATFEDLKSQDPDAFEVQYSKDQNVLNEKKDILSKSKCSVDRASPIGLGGPQYGPATLSQHR